MYHSSPHFSQCWERRCYLIMHSNHCLLNWGCLFLQVTVTLKDKMDVSTIYTSLSQTKLCLCCEGFKWGAKKCAGSDIWCHVNSYSHTKVECDKNDQGFSLTSPAYDTLSWVGSVQLRRGKRSPTKWRISQKLRISLCRWDMLLYAWL